jgi:hypothetical protein
MRVGLGMKSALRSGEREGAAAVGREDGLNLLLQIHIEL